MITLKHKDLLDAGVHFGHLTRKWHPNMAPFIFMERNGIHIIDLNKTLLHLQEAVQALKNIARSGRKILFVGTKKQSKSVIEQAAKHLDMPYVTERWLGGTLTNFSTIRKLLKKMSSFDRLMKDTAYKNMAKKEQLMIAREKSKLERLLQGIADVTRLPAALFVVDIKKEHIAVREAQKLGIPVFALADTNVNPLLVDYPIPGNDDAARSVALIINAISSGIEEGLAERQQTKEATTPKDTKVTAAVDAKAKIVAPSLGTVAKKSAKTVTDSQTEVTAVADTKASKAKKVDSSPGTAAKKSAKTATDSQTDTTKKATATPKQSTKPAKETTAKQATVAKATKTVTPAADTKTDKRSPLKNTAPSVAQPMDTKEAKASKKTSAKAATEGTAESTSTQ